MRWTALIAIAIAVTTWPAAGQDDRRVDLEIGEDTTFFDGPVNDDGTIDYIAALNTHYGEGIANGDNAFVVLVQLFAEQEPDRWEDQEAHWGQVFEVLGIDPPADRVRFADWKAFAAGLGLNEREALERYNAVLEGPWVVEDHSEIAAWLEANEPALGLLREALEREQYFSPIVAAEDDGSLLGTLNPQLGHCRRLARQLLIRFYRALAEGDARAAVDLAWSIDRLGCLGAGEPTFIGKLTALGNRRLAGDAIEVLCERGSLGHEDALRLIEMRMQSPDARTPAEAMHYTDRCMGLEQVQLLYLKLMDHREAFVREHGGQFPELNEVFDVNQSLRQMNVYYDQVQDIMREADEAERRRLVAEYDDEIWGSYGEPILARAILFGVFRVVTGQGFPTRHFTEQLTLKLAQTLMPAVGSANRTRFRTDARRLVDAAGLALLGYRDMHGSLPESLDALVPMYFEGVPTDPYSDGPLLYRVSADGSALVYSIGDNFRDDGGVDDYREGDIAIRIGPPPAE